MEKNELLLKIIFMNKMLLQVSFANVILLFQYTYADSSNASLKPCKYENFNQWYKDAIPKDYEKLNFPPLPENVTQFPVKGTAQIFSSFASEDKRLGPENPSIRLEFLA